MVWTLETRGVSMVLSNVEPYIHKILGSDKGNSLSE